VLVVKVIVAGCVLEQPIAVAEITIVIRIDVGERIANDGIGIADIGRAHGEAKHAMCPGCDSVFDGRARSRLDVVAAERPR
jgi:hypothetical protein